MKDNVQFSLSNADETPKYDRHNIYSRDVLLGDMLLEKEEEPEEEAPRKKSTSFRTQYITLALSEKFFDKSMEEIRVLNNTLTRFGAKPYIEKEKESFVIGTFLYLLFLQDYALQEKYSTEFEEISLTLDIMLLEITNRFNCSASKLKDYYLELRNFLADLPNGKIINKSNVYYALGIHYLQNVLSDFNNTVLENNRNNAEKDGVYADTVEFSVATFFQKAMNDNMEYLFNNEAQKFEDEKKEGKSEKQTENKQQTEKEPSVKKTEKAPQTVTREKELEYLTNRKNELQAQITEKEEKVERKQTKRFIYVTGIYTAIFYVAALCIGMVETNSSHEITKAVFICLLIGFAFAGLALVLSNTLFSQASEEYIEIQDIKEQLEETKILIEEIEKTERKIEEKKRFEENPPYSN